MISVIMSIYQEELDWIRKAICSILNQTYPNLEFIIIVDNPFLPEDVRYYLNCIKKEDSRIRLYFNDINKGLAECMNQAISLVQGDYIARMDADDISFPERLAEEMEYIENSKADMVATFAERINEKGEVVSEFKRKCYNINLCLPYVNYIIHPSVLIKTFVLKELGGYRNFRTSQDYDLWLRIISAGYQIEIIEKVLLQYRISTQSVSTTKCMEQFYTAKYQRYLYHLAKRKHDNLNLDEFKTYLKKIDKVSRQKRFIRAKEEADIFFKERKIRTLSSGVHFVKSIRYYPTYLPYIVSLKLRMIIRILIDKFKKRVFS